MCTVQASSMHPLYSSFSFPFPLHPNIPTHSAPSISETISSASLHTPTLVDLTNNQLQHCNILKFPLFYGKSSIHSIFSLFKSLFHFFYIPSWYSSFSPLSPLSSPLLSLFILYPFQYSSTFPPYILLFYFPFLILFSFPSPPPSPPPLLFVFFKYTRAFCIALTLVMFFNDEDAPHPPRMSLYHVLCWSVPIPIVLACLYLGLFGNGGATW